ncbi:MAG: acetyltransferase [Burkholderiales bacterium]|nr:acetyltransferase [Burkholderiales bacterium]MBH2070777.1 acetyltransferase [Burkholderiales bacterium]
MKQNVVIFGCGGFAREVHQIIEDINAAAGNEVSLNFLGFLDGNTSLHGTEVHGYPVLGGLEWLDQPHAAPVHISVAVANCASRKKIVNAIETGGKAVFLQLVHPRAWVGNRVVIGEGTIICAGALVTTDIELGRHVIINIGATVGHDARIDDFVTVAPSVNVSGAVLVGPGCDLGTGSAIIQGKTIGAWSVVGAGAVVVKDVDPNVTVVGSPAKIIKTRQPGWHQE